MTAEQVLSHYHMNVEKAQQAMLEAELDGRIGLSSLVRTCCFVVLCTI